MTVIAFSRTIGPVPISCVLSEKHSSELRITGNPIETGAEVNDHAYVKPKKVVLEIGDANAALTFETLIRFQESRVPFNLVTGLKVYSNMLIQDIDATRDKTHAYILKAKVTCLEVIIVSTGTATEENEPNGNSGGKNSKGAAKPTPSNRAASSVQSGDNPTNSVSGGKSQSLLKQMF